MNIPYTSVSTKNYDSEFCGSLPLGVINLIQPHGILMVVSLKDLSIVQVSENITRYFIKVSDLLDQKITDFISEADQEIFKQTVQKKEIQEKIPLNIFLRFKEKEFLFFTLIHIKDEYVILELEETHSTEQDSFINVYQNIKYIMASLSGAKSIQEIAAISAKEIKKISGFDKVMIYKFDEEWNGTVIAEAMEERMTSYLGLRFPASDIPKQARDLYFKNPYRLIPNNDYTPVKLHPILNPVTNSFIDLSDCDLRSVASVHLEYLRNMNVTASMSTRIIVNNKLWGLISCHHSEAKYLNFQMCSIFELLSNIISSQITTKENEHEYNFTSRLNEIQSRLIEQMYSREDFIDGIFHQSPNILDLLSIDGVAIIYEKEIRRVGKTPAENEIKDIKDWLYRNRIEKIFWSTNFPSQFDKSSGYAGIASGLIVIPISLKRGEYILGFRPEVITEINWGGNPNEAIQFEPDRKNYHPRNSFSIWKETVKHSSKPWNKSEIQAAEFLRNSIIEFLLKVKV